jgi:hypothetical protein
MRQADAVVGGNRTRGRQRVVVAPLAAYLAAAPALGFLRLCGRDLLLTWGFTVQNQFSGPCTRHGVTEC